MDRRRALLAASAVSASAGGEFYCELWRFNPRTGVYTYARTATFIIPLQITWGEADGLIDTEERTKIRAIQLPSGQVNFLISNLKKEDGSTSYYAESELLPSENIGIGRTYKWLEG